MKAMDLQKAGKELIFTNGAPSRAGHLGKGACCRSSAAAAAARTLPESTTAAQLAVPAQLFPRLSANPLMSTHQLGCCAPCSGQPAAAGPAAHQV